MNATTNIRRETDPADRSGDGISASLADSGWFWLALFAGTSLLALQWMAWKYERRQAQLERQFQGREWAAQHGAEIRMTPGSSPSAGEVPVVARDDGAAATAEVPGDDPPARSAMHAEQDVSRQAPGDGETAVPSAPRFSAPGDLIISLSPLRWVALAALLIAGVELAREHRRRAATARAVETAHEVGG